MAQGCASTIKNTSAWNIKRLAVTSLQLQPSDNKWKYANAWKKKLK